MYTSKPVAGRASSVRADPLSFYSKLTDWHIDSDVISLDVMGNTMIILNSAQATSDLFEKRGAYYSDRPDMPMIVDLMGWDWTFALMRYGPRWKEHRRVFHSHFNQGTTEHQTIQLNLVQELLQLLARSPENYLSHMRQCVHASCRFILVVELRQQLCGSYHHEESVCLLLYFPPARRSR